MALTQDEIDAAFADLEPTPTPRLSSVQIDSAFADLQPTESQPAEPRDTTFGEKAKGTALALGGATITATKALVQLLGVHWLIYRIPE